MYIGCFLLNAILFCATTAWGMEEEKLRKVTVHNMLDILLCVSSLKDNADNQQSFMDKKPQCVFVGPEKTKKLWVGEENIVYYQKATPVRSKAWPQTVAYNDIVKGAKRMKIVLQPDETVLHLDDGNPGENIKG